MIYNIFFLFHLTFLLFYLYNYLFFSIFLCLSHIYFMFIKVKNCIIINSYYMFICICYLWKTPREGDFKLSILVSSPSISTTINKSLTENSEHSVQVLNLQSKVSHLKLFRNDKKWFPFCFKGFLRYINFYPGIFGHVRKQFGKKSNINLKIC